MSRNIKIIEIDPNINGYEDFIKDFNDAVDSEKHIFLFLFMDGCGPCNETKPQWKKMQKLLKKDRKINNADIIVASINQKLFERLRGIGNEPMGYPCLRCVKGNAIEEYEDSIINNKNRSAESFIEWIESKVKKQYGGKKSRRRVRGGKWSLKYKKSINCREPKGFSQKQYCKYGRKTLKQKH
jgi:hypothetical protein